MDEKNAEQLKVRTRAAFDAQAATYDAGMEGEHARRLYPHVLGEVRAAVAGLAAPRLLDLGCGTGALAERVLGVAPGGALVIGDAWQPAPARAVMNAWLPRSREGDVRIYSEAELRDILGAWFAEVSWRHVGMTACVAVARKGR